MLKTYDSRRVERTHRGWGRMWGVIAERYGDTSCLHDGEAWQYMGTWTDNGWQTWEHEFRHRALPPEGTRTYCKVDDFEETGAPL
jgi:hypothetical protein